jgi:hypothetical protein
MNCRQCEAIAINGRLCHETGCPIAWETETRECKWCGAKFVPEGRWQQYCDEDCAAAYNGRYKAE